MHWCRLPSFQDGNLHQSVLEGENEMVLVQNQKIAMERDRCERQVLEVTDEAQRRSQAMREDLISLIRHHRKFYAVSNYFFPLIESCLHSETKILSFLSLASPSCFAPWHKGCNAAHSAGSAPCTMPELPLNCNLSKKNLCLSYVIQGNSWRCRVEQSPLAFAGSWSSRPKFPFAGY